MKKLFTFALLGLSMVMLTGCGKNQITCTGAEEQDGQKIEMKVTAKPKDGKVTEATATMTFAEEDTAKQMCSLFEMANGLTEEGKKLDIKCDGKDITIKNYLLMQDDAKEEYTEDEFIKLMEDGKLTCKK